MNSNLSKRRSPSPSNMHKLIEILNADRKFGIGKRNGLLFHLPLDMAFFRETTLGHIVVMGENTLLSFPNSKPLKNRVNVVLSADETHNYKNVVNVHTMQQLLEFIAYHLRFDDVYVIGGASIYRQLLPYCDEVLLTKVDADGGAEVFFENLDERDDFVLVQEGEPQMDGDIPIRFCTYLNTKKTPVSLENGETGTKHALNLYPGPFEAIKNGRKDIEMRLNEEKRQNLKVGDVIVFTNTESKEQLECKILGFAPFDSFDLLYSSFPKERLGYSKEEEAHPADMERYYLRERIEKYGPLAIFIKALIG